MKAEYDSIAKLYQKSKERFYYRIVDYSFKKIAGSLTGLNAMDLACGEGHTTRQLKMYGATKVIGVDISRKMVRLAEEKETKTPYGIKYFCSPVQELGYIEEFDLVTGMFLLYYAKNKDELFQICKNIYINLKDGGRFIGINGDGIKKHLFCDFSKYETNTRIIANKSIKEGEQYHYLINFEGEPIKLTMYYYSRKTYNEIFKEVGFKKTKWVKLSVPPGTKNNPKLKHWCELPKEHAECLIVCEK